MATNTLGVYSPIFYAQNALAQLEEVMGMARTVHRGYDAERDGFRRGEVISIRRPSVFTAQDAPSSAQNLNTGTVNITLNKWKEVKFELTDKELAFTQERIVQDHIRPAARALASDVDQSLHALFADIPWQHALPANGTRQANVSDITNSRQILFDNKVPLMDPSMLHMVVDGAVENEFLQLEAFSQNQGAGADGVGTQTSGMLGRKYGFNIQANQNVPSFTAGALSDGSSDLATSSEVTAGTATVPLAGTSVTGDVYVGDIITFDGVAQQYVILSAATAAANAISVTVGVPGRGTGVRTTIPNGTAATVTQTSGIGVGLAYHTHAFALATAPLSEMGDGRGAEIATITDPFTGLSLRSRIYYDGDNSAVRVALDILYGVKTLDANMATRVVNPD